MPRRRRRRNALFSPPGWGLKDDWEPDKYWFNWVMAEERLNTLLVLQELMGSEGILHYDHIVPDDGETMLLDGPIIEVVVPSEEMTRWLAHSVQYLRDLIFTTFSLDNDTLEAMVKQGLGHYPEIGYYGTPGTRTYFLVTLGNYIQKLVGLVSNGVGQLINWMNVRFDVGDARQIGPMLSYRLQELREEMRAFKKLRNGD